MLRKVSIKNFKSVKDASLSLPRFGAIIGKNGSGKTNFIQAIILLKKLVDGETIDFARQDGISFFTNEFFFVGNESSENEAEFEFQFTSNDACTYVYSYAVGYDGDHGFYISKESLSKDDKLVFKRKGGTDGNVYDGEKTIPYSVDKGSLVIENYTNDDVVELRQLVLAYTIVDAPLSEKKEFKVITPTNPSLDTIDGVAVSLYTKDKKLYEQAIDTVKKIIPTFKGLDLVPIQENKNDTEQTAKNKSFIVTWLSPNDEQRYSHYSVSHGDRKVIHLIFSLFNTKSKAFLIAEEIENGMHFGRLERLVDQLRTQAFNLKVQLLFTTHSSQLLNDLTPSEVIYCRKDSNGATLIDLLTDTDEFKAIKDELSESEVTAANLVNAGFFD